LGKRHGAMIERKWPRVKGKAVERRAVSLRLEVKTKYIRKRSRQVYVW
jgi:hypothetical protein